MNSGILLIDKPQGMTSHDVVARVRKAAGTRKVGHAGTLDPMATGLLVIGLNSSTRLLTFLVGLDKRYTATIRLGVSTVSDDAEGEVLDIVDASAVSDEAIATGIADLTGELDQVPTKVSAIKVQGRRAYDLVRQGVEVALEPRRVAVTRFDRLALRRLEVAGSAVIDVDVDVECTSGTYIRALARDLGARLGVGGHLTALRRTRVGPFPVEAAATLETLDVSAQVIPPQQVAQGLFAQLALSAQQALDLSHGKRVVVEHPDSERPVAAITPEGRLAGLITVQEGIARTIVNFPTEEVLA